jgi:hypothetical protein
MELVLSGHKLNLRSCAMNIYRYHRFVRLSGYGTCKSAAGNVKFKVDGPLVIILIVPTVIIVL